MEADRPHNPEPRPKRRSRGAARTVSSVAAILCVLLVAAFLYSRSATGRDAIVRFALGMIPLNEGYSLDFARTGGSLPSDLTILGLTMHAPDGTTLVRVDTLRLGLRVAPLLRRGVRMTHLHGSGVDVQMAQDDSGSWDLIDAIPMDTTSTGLSIRMGEVAISRLSVRAAYHAESDSVLVAGPAFVRAHDIEMVDRYGGRIDSLRAPFTPAGLKTEAVATLGASFYDGALQVRHASLNSDRSALRVTGNLSLEPEAARFRVEANPLAFADIAPFARGLDPDVVAEGNAEVHRGHETDDDTWAGAGNFSFGARGSVTFDALWKDADSVRYAATLQTSRLDPGIFFAAIPPGGGDFVTGTIAADLAGPDLRHLTGHVRLDLRESRLPTFELFGPTVEAAFAGGEASLNASASYRATTVAVAGAATPFGPEPTYDLTADFSGLSFTELPIVVTGTARLAGAGFADPDVTITPRLRTSRIGGLAVASATGTGRFAGGTLDVDLDVVADTGSAHIRGSWSIPDARWRVESFGATDLDVLSVTGSGGTSRFTGTAGGSGSGLDSGDFVLTVDSFATPTVEVRRGRLAAQLSDGTITFSHDSRVNGALLTGRSAYRPPVSGQRTAHDVTIYNARIDSLDVSSLPGLESQAGIVSAALQGEVSFSSAASIRGLMELTILPSTINDAPIRDGAVAIEFDGASTRFEFAASIGDGSLRGSGDGTPFVERPRATIDRFRMDRLDVGPLLGLDAVSSSLTGDVTLSYDAAAAEPIRASARLESSSVNGQRGISGALTAVGAFDAGTATWGFSWPQTTSSAPGGLSGSVRLLPDSADASGRNLVARVSTEHLDVSRWWPADASRPAVLDTTKTDLSLSVRYAGNAAPLDSLRGIIEVDSLRGSIDDHSISTGRLSVRADAGLLDVDELTLETSAGLIEGSGPLVLDGSDRQSDFFLSANAEDLALIGDLIPRTQRIGGIGSMTATVSGPGSRMRIMLDGTLGAIEYGTNRVGSAEVFADALLDGERELTALEGDVRLLNTLVGTASIREVRVQATTADSLVQFQALSTIDGRRDVSISGTLDPRSGAQEVRILGVNIRLDNDRWSLLQPSTISYGEAFRIRNLLLFTDDQQIAVDGIIDLDGDQSLILTVEEFRIGAVADLLGYRGLDGTVNGYLDLLGPADSPTMQGDLDVELESNRRPVGDLRLALAYDSLRLEVDGRLQHTSGGTMEFLGNLPVDLRLASTRGPTQTGMRVRARQAEPDSDVDLQVVADSFSVGWILPFLDPDVYSDLDGVVDGRMNMLGTFSEPMMTGSAELTNARVGLPLFGIDVRSINGTLIFEDRNILIENIRGESGRGRMTALGSIELSDLSLGEFDISFDLDNFLAVDNADYRAATAGDLLLYGTTRHPVVSGYLRLESLDIYYKGALEEFEPVTLSERDLREVELVFGRRVTAADTTTYDFYTALEIDINVEMTRDSWLRSYQNPRMDIPFYGSLDILKQPAGEMEAFGTIDIIEDRGRIVELGRRFDIRRGTVTYNGAFDNPRVDLEAEYRVRQRGASGQTGEDIVVSLAATGTLQDLNLNLTSEPTMETTDILSYVLVGRPARESLQFGGGEESIAADIALSQAAGFLEGLAGEELGLDVVRIEYEGTEVKLTAGKYLRSGVYVAISQPIVLSSEATQSTTGSSAERQLLLEVEIISGLLARVQQQGAIFGLNLFWQYAY